MLRLLLVDTIVMVMSSSFSTVSSVVRRGIFGGAASAAARARTTRPSLIRRFHHDRNVSAAPWAASSAGIPPSSFSREAPNQGNNATTIPVPAAAIIWTARRGRHDDSSTENEEHKPPVPVSDDNSGAPVRLPLSQRWTRRFRRGASDVISGLGFLSSSFASMYKDQRQYRKWRPTLRALETFLRESGIRDEMSQSLNLKVWDYAVMLGQVQKRQQMGRDIRDCALSKRGWFWGSVGMKDLPSREECARYMRYATAAYGDAMMRAAELDVRGTFRFFDPIDDDDAMASDDLPALTKRRVCRHVGLGSDDDLVLMDVDYDGDAQHLRHFVAVDHENQKVVLAIRGTFSLSELVVDLAGFTRKKVLLILPYAVLSCSNTFLS